MTNKLVYIVLDFKASPEDTVISVCDSKEIAEQKVRELQREGLKIVVEELLGFSKYKKPKPSKTQDFYFVSKDIRVGDRVIINGFKG